MKSFKPASCSAKNIRVGLNRVKFQLNQDVYMSPKNKPVKWPAILEISISTHFARVLLAQRTSR